MHIKFHLIVINSFVEDDSFIVFNFRSICMTNLNFFCQKKPKLPGGNFCFSKICCQFNWECKNEKIKYHQIPWWNRVRPNGIKGGENFTWYLLGMCGCECGWVWVWVGVSPLPVSAKSSNEFDNRSRVWVSPHLCPHTSVPTIICIQRRTKYHWKIPATSHNFGAKCQKQPLR